MRLLVWLMKKIFKFPELMQLVLFNSNEDNDLKSIDELRALRLRNQKIENDKKARNYISEINQRYKKMKDKNSNNSLTNNKFFKRAS